MMVAAIFAKYGVEGTLTVCNNIATVDLSRGIIDFPSNWSENRQQFLDTARLERSGYINICSDGALYIYNNSYTGVAHDFIKEVAATGNYDRVDVNIGTWTKPYTAVEN